MSKMYILNKILSKKEMFNLYFIFFLMIINSFLEAFSIGALIPLLSIVFGIDDSNFFGSKNFNFLEEINLNISIDFLIFSIIGLYLIKYAFFVLYTRFQTGFILNLTVSLRRRLFEDYLNKPLKFHNKILSAEIVRNINNEVAIFVKNFVSAILTFSLSLFTITLILILLLLVNVKSTLVIIAIFGFIYVIIGKIFSKWLQKVGKDRQYHNKFSIKYIYRSLQSIMEIKLLELEKFYVKNYIYHINKIAQQSINRNIVGIMPKILFEATLIIFVLLVIYYYKINNLSIESLFAQLLLFATAAFRVMPALNIIAQSRQQVQFGQPAAELLCNIIDNFEPKEILNNNKISNEILFKKNISIKNMSFSYDEDGKEIVKNFNLNISKNDSIGIVGSNGSGKSTLVKLLCGLLEPTKGVIEIDGLNINNQIKQWRRLIGFVPQEINLIDGTIKENICLGLKEENINNEKILEVINRAQLTDFIEKLPNGINSYIGESGVNISGGERQKLGIARTLYRDHEIIILDEATSHLDSNSEIEFIKMLDIQYKNKTKIIVSHRVEALKFCKKIFNIDNIKKYEN